jgi:hypothetical protein
MPSRAAPDANEPWAWGDVYRPFPVARMSDRDRSDHRPVDRFYLFAIVGYVLLAAGFIGYFVWRWVS